MRRLVLPSLAFVISLALPAAAAAQTATSPVSVGGVLQMLLGLGVVLGMVIGCAWVLKRLSLHQGAAGGAVRVVAGAAVGQRERVVVVEVGETWVVVGVAPGRVTALHAMPRGESPIAMPAQRPAPRSFAQWLRLARDGQLAAPRQPS